MRWFALLMMVLGCGSSGGSDGEGDDFDCELGMLSGSYLLSFETIDGTCGDQASALVTFGAMEGMGSECTNLIEPRYGADRCTLETQVSCPFVVQGCPPRDANGPGESIEATTIIHQSNDSGSELDGTMTLRAVCGNGAIACVGTYRISYDRQ